MAEEVILAKKIFLKDKEKKQSLYDHSLSVYEEFLKHDYNISFLNKIINNYLKKEIEQKNIKSKEYFKLTEEETSLIIKKIFFLISFFHDLGKGVEDFKKRMSKQFEDNEINIDHHVYSYLLFNNLDIYIENNDEKRILNKYRKGIIEYAILYHHSFDFNDYYRVLLENRDKVSNKIKKIKKEMKEHLIKNIEDFIKEDVYDNYLKEVQDRYFKEFNEKISFQNSEESRYGELSVLKYKDYFDEITEDKIEKNALYTFTRFLFNHSDRNMSKEFEEKDSHFNNLDNLNLEDFANLDDETKFSLNERTIAQNNKVAQIVERFKQTNAVVLDGAPGIGKTRMFLKTFIELKDKRQLIIVTPRNTIAKNLYLEFKKANYFNQNISIEILNSQEQLKYQNNIEITLEHENEMYKSNIMIISFDRLISFFNENKLIYKFLNTSRSLVVFDEFHEIYDQSLLSVYFIEMMKVFKMLNTSVLLTSGTINPVITKKQLNINEEDVVILNSFNSKKINLYVLNISAKDSVSLNIKKSLENEKFKFNENLKKLIQADLITKEQGFIDIANKVNSSQKILFETLFNNKLKREQCVYNIHSYYSTENRNELFNEILEKFKRIKINGLNENKNIIFSGPILQASLNITTRNMFTSISSPENLLQRMGRLNRFEEDLKSNLFITFDEEDETDKKERSELNNNFILFLIDKLKKDKKRIETKKDEGGKSYLAFLVEINDLRKLYHDFYLLENTQIKMKNFIEKDIFEKAESFEYKKGIYPYKYNNKNRKEINEKSNFSLKTLRGESGFNVICPSLELNMNDKSIKTLPDKKEFNLSIEKLGAKNLVRSLLSMIDKNVEFRKTNFGNFIKNNNKDLDVIELRNKTFQSNLKKNYKFDMSSISFESVEEIFYPHYSFLYLKIKKDGLNEEEKINLGLMQTLLIKNFLKDLDKK